MLIKELKPNAYVKSIKIKIDKFIKSGEIEKNGKKVKFEEWEVLDEENNSINCTFWAEENIKRINENISKWIMAYNFKFSEYEGNFSLNSSYYGYVKPIEGLY